MPVSTETTKEMFELMKRLPHPKRRTPSVEYVPLPRRSDKADKASQD